MPIDDEERANNERLLKIYRRNLQRLLEQKAQLGSTIALENQIDDARAQIALLEPLAPTQKTQETAQNATIDLTTLYIQGTQLAAEQARQADQNKEILEQNKGIIEQQAIDTLWRAQTKTVIHEVVAEVAAAKAEVAATKVIVDERYEAEQVVRKERQQEHDERSSLMEEAITEIKEQVQLLTGRNSFNRGLLVILIIIALVILFVSIRGG